MDSRKKVTKPVNPSSIANPLSKFTYTWVFKLFYIGCKRDLELTDLYEPLDEHRSGYLGNKIEIAWNRETRRSAKKNETPSLLRVIASTFGSHILLFGILLFFMEIVVRIVQPLFLGRLVRYFMLQNSTQEMKTSNVVESVALEDAYMYAGGVIFCSAIFVIVIHPYYLGILHIGMKIRVACCSLIYRKALRLSKTALGQTTVGQIVNLLSNDVSRFDLSVVFIHYLWIAPLQTMIVTYFIWQEIGFASVVGVSILLIAIPFQAYLGKKMSTLRLMTALRTDERVRLMNEIISGIQVIKMYTWEKPFAKLVSNSRRKEINVIRKSAYLHGIMFSFVLFHSRVALFFSIFYYVFFGNYINSEKVFVIISYFNVLRDSSDLFSIAVGQVAEAYISTKRVQSFMLYDEIKEHHIAAETQEKINGFDISLTKKNKIPPNTENCAISMSNVVAKWMPNLNENTLNDVTIRFPTGGITAVIGLVGAGKSSLFHAILKELPIESGNIDVQGKVSYASQEPWLFAGSVRQNILFGETYDKERYHAVTKVCALKMDFDQLPYGDKTMVSDRGVSLSGGQRARINLARAVYKKADIYLFDDPLSAVDSHVGKHLLEDCIIEYLKDKTRVLITHRLQYLNVINHIVILENGMVIAEGSYKELLESGKDFAKLLSSLEKEDEAGDGKASNRKRTTSVQSVDSSIADESHPQEEPSEVTEMRSLGTIGWDVCLTYFRSGGSVCLTFCCLSLFLLTQVFASGADYWVTFWVNLEEQNKTFIDASISSLSTATVLPTSSNSYITNVTMSPINRNFVEAVNSKISSTILDTDFNIHFTRENCLYIFFIITIGLVIITLLRSIIFFKMCMKSSINLHDTMFTSITRATMQFFNTNPAGRILNRFSKDMGSIDETLPSTLIECVQICLSLIGVVVVILVVNIWLLVPTFCVSVIFYILRKVFVSTSRSVKRLEGVTRSPVFSHLNASIQGLATIRAFDAQQILVKEFDNHQDLHSSTWYIYMATSRAFAYWLDVICVLYIAIVTLSFLVLGNESFGGNVGLAISQSISLTGLFQWGMRQTAELEIQMTAVERVLEYTDIKKEPPLESAPGKMPEASWPNKGEIVFDKVYLKYFPSDPPVLKNLTFTIQPGEKVGIVGRTGAGKSSLISALYRLADLEGKIVIDKIDTAEVGLHDVRSKISIIPQEPFLFSGTMRKNLDPFDEYSDDKLWCALEEVELKEVVSDLPGGLNSIMSEGGTNFSVGQRQLVCLARAIIRKNKILVLDEATANIDPHTDSLIQLTIRKKFSECTMLTIAHRLDTVMDSDRVLVIDAGRVVEFDHPHLLLKNNEGYFYRMVEKTGKATSELLHKMAKYSYIKKCQQ